MGRLFATARGNGCQSACFVHLLNLVHICSARTLFGSLVVVGLWEGVKVITERS
jgi:uncharacterized membrane protein